MTIYIPAYKPWEHQNTFQAKAGDRDAFALFAGMRTGKSKMTLDRFGRLELEQKVNDLLVLAPGGVYKTWEKALFGDPAVEGELGHLSADLRARLTAHTWRSGANQTQKRALQTFMQPSDKPRTLLMNIEALSSVKEARDVAKTFLKQRKSKAAIDECFVAGTLVSVPGGYVPIERLAPGDLVWTSRGNSRVKRCFKKTTQTVAKIKLSDGRYIVSTVDHPIFTDLGWLPASAIFGRLVFGTEDLSNLWDTIPSRQPQEALLRDILLCEMAYESSGNPGEDLHRSAEPEDKQGSQREETRHSFLEQECADEGGFQGEAKCDFESNGPSTQGTGRQRAANDRTAEAIPGDLGFALGSGICDRVGRKAAWLSILLQSGLGQSGNATGDRVRWAIPRQPGSPEEGREEGRQIGGTRVVGVEIEECQSPIAVFNLELDGTPHFFAEGILAHNCTIIKNPTSKRTKFCNRELASEADYRLILSGLPNPRSPLDYYAEFEFLDWKLLGFRSYFSFRARYAKMAPIQVGGRTIQVVKGYQNLEDLTRRLDPHCYRVALRDCYDVPEKMYLFREVEMTPEQVRIYGEMKRYATAKLDGEAHVTATVVIAQITRLSQILCGHVPDEEGKLHEIPENRTQAVLDILADYDGKAIIWCAYSSDIVKVSTAVAEEYGEAAVARFWGGNQNVREDEERRFLHDPECRYMFATAAAGSRGRTWTVADLIIYHSNTEDLEHRDQSEERGSGIGKDDRVTVIDLCVRGTVDEKKIKSLRAKIDLATAVNGEGYRAWLI